MAIAPPPIYTPLPTPPSRLNNAAQFSSMADAFYGVMPTFGAQLNALASYSRETALAAMQSATDSAESASLAASKAQLATTNGAQQVTLAKAQADTAITQAQLAADARATAQAAAAAAQAAAGLPSLTGKAGKVLKVNGGATGIGWDHPAGTGDVLLSGASLPAPAWEKCTGSLLGAGVYPALTALLGASLNPDMRVKLADPAVLPTGQGNDSAFSPDGTYLAVVHATSPFLTVYNRSGDTFTKLADPAVLPAGNGKECTFSADGTYLAVTVDISPYIDIYKRSGDIFTKLAGLTTSPGGSNSVAYSPDGNYLVLGRPMSPYLSIYKSADALLLPAIASPDPRLNYYIKTGA